MKNFARLQSMFTGKTGNAKVRFVLFLLALVLFVLGSGAPEAGGGVSERLPFFFF